MDKFDGHLKEILRQALQRKMAYDREEGRRRQLIVA
jgi:hypothetical protein